MSGEIVVPETPNWLKVLEEKREYRLKARLGHEAGAGAPCLKCGDKCPGLDLHFWRKACKICRCPKEEHDVHDDDIYGWAQFQLLGSKPNKIKTKIVLPGKKDEVELEWAPKGQKDTIDKYLKTLPPEALPVKGSQAAQERKQMLQKQIPIHDIDPSLCHELNEDEVKQMEEYIAHIKKSSVGVGQIVNLSNVIKANLHNISPEEAHIIASRYSKGIPFSEIVKLQSSLSKNLEKLTLGDANSPKNKSGLPNMQPNKLGSNIVDQQVQNPLVASKYKDITHPWYSDSSPNKGLSQPRYAQGFKPNQSGGPHGDNQQNPGVDHSINQKLFGENQFDPTKTPSQFLGYHTPGYRPVQPKDPQTIGQDHSAEELSYNRETSKPPLGNISYASDVGRSKELKSGHLGSNKEGLPYNQISKGFKPLEVEEMEVGGMSPEQFFGLHGGKNSAHGEAHGFENPYFNRNHPETGDKYGRNAGVLPGYSPNRGNPEIDMQDPKLPKSVKDLIYSTYDPSRGPLPEDNSESDTRNKKIDPTDLGYDPNINLNTYKHDPSVIKHEKSHLIASNEPVQPLDKARFASGIPRDHKQGYFDPKSGEYVPGAGHPQYDPRKSPNPHRSGYIDPKTGKYVPNYDPMNSDHGRFDPQTGKPLSGDHRGHFDPQTGKFIPADGSFDPEGRQHPYGSGYRDPVTGSFVGDDGHLDNRHESGYTDPKTGKYLPHYDPMNSEHGMFDPETGKPLSGEHRGHFNPKTGKFIPADGSFDPEGRQYPYGSGYTDPARYFDPKTGTYIAGTGNNPEEGNYGGTVDPRTGKYLPGHGNNRLPHLDSRNPGAPHGPGHFDPKTGKFIPSDDNFDPERKPHSQGSGYIDPTTGKYVGVDDDPKNPGYFDPNTGKYISEGSKTAPEGGYYDPTISEQGKFDPRTGKYLGGDGNRSLPYGSGAYDPKTGKYTPADSHFDPEGVQHTPYGAPHNTTPGAALGSNRPQNISANPDSKFGTPGKPRKPLSQLQPGQLNIHEDYLEPSRVNIGAIQDINPDIKEAMTAPNPGFDTGSVYSDEGEYSPDSIKEILNNVKLPDCHYCKKPFEENEYAVTLDRANVLFHARCFKCAGCNQSLADNIYFYHKETNNVYCGRDYAKIKGYPRCSACDELIFTKEYCLAENSTFHLKHFCCFQCDTPLAGQGYTLEDEKTYCLPCYETSKAAKCSTCESIIKPDEPGCQLNGIHFHAEDRCFRCIVCSMPLMGKKMLLRNEKLFCSHECYNNRKQ